MYMDDVQDLFSMHMMISEGGFSEMIYSRLIIDGNAVYEIDDECMEKLCRSQALREQERKEKRRNGGKNEKH